MLNKQSLQRDLQNLDLRPTDTVLIHSSMRSIGPVEGGADAVLDVLMDYFSLGTLVLPTHTWATHNHQGQRDFDIQNTPCCVGILPELFRRRTGVLRSVHPTHSVAAFGAGAGEFVQGEAFVHSPCAREGCWGKLLDRRAKILMVGCDLRCMTFFHGVEEWCGIENRLGERDEYQVRLADGQTIRMQVARHIGTPSEQYPFAQQALIDAGALTFGRFGNAKVFRLEADRSYETVAALLKENPRLFDDVHLTK